MPFPTFLEKDGSRSASGFATESVFGTAVAANTFLPMYSNTLEYDPGWFSPELMMAARDLHVFNLYGEAKLQGAIEGPLFPSNAIPMTVAGVGLDNQVGTGIFGTIATPTSTTVNGNTIVGATTVTLTSGTGFVVGQEIVVDSGALQEARKITNVATNVITVADAFIFAHATGVAAVTGTTTTINGALTAPTSTVVVTSATGITQNSFIQIDVNSVSGSTTSEVRKVTNVVTNTLTLDSPIVYNHANGVQVILVTTPYNHTISQANTLPSLTVEKNIGSFQSLQFAGCRVGKYSVKAPVGNEPIKISADVSGQSVLVLNTPTAVSVTNELPYVFTEASLTVFGTTRFETTNVELDINNGLKETWTYSGNHGPAYITPVTVSASGKLDVVFDSLNDTTYGDYTKMVNGTLGQLQLAFTHPTNGGVVAYNLPQVVISKFANDLKMTDVVMSGLTFEATRPLSGNTQYTVSATIINSQYLSY